MAKRSTWKSVERAIAREVGGERVPITGRVRDQGKPDIDHDRFSIEVKHRKALPSWIKDAVDQSEKSNKDGSKVPIVVLHEKNQKYKDSFVLIRLSDLLECCNGVHSNRDE